MTRKIIIIDNDEICNISEMRIIFNNINDFIKFVIKFYLIENNVFNILISLNNIDFVDIIIVLRDIEFFNNIFNECKFVS